MWNRFQLPFTRPQPGSDAADPIDPNFDRLVCEALHGAPASDALRARVADTLRQELAAAAPAPTARRLPMGKLGYVLAAGVALVVAAPFMGGRGWNGAAEAAVAPTPGQLALLDKAGNPGALCPLKHTDVRADVKGYVARVSVEQQFHNPSNEPVEAVYTFPLPEDAAVDDMTIRIGNRIVQGEIKRKEEAHHIYEQAKENGQTAALLDQERPNIFTQSLANLMPGSDVTVRISYTNLLKYDNGGYELAYPMVVGPRFIPGSGGYQAPGLRGEPSPAKQVEPDPGTTAVVTDAEKITPPITPPNTRAGHDISVTVNLDAGMQIGDVKSTLHAVDVDRPAPDRATIRLRDQNSIPNKDFILRYTVAGKEIRSSVLANQGPDGSGYFTLVLQPPAMADTHKPDSRELFFVIDQTGSQSGWPIAKAKETMRFLIRNMNPDDTFQLLGFNTDVFPCFEGPVHNTPDNVAKALRFLEPLEGEGGTDILKAAEYALNTPGTPGRQRLICYLTDGFIGDDMQVIDYVRKHRDQAHMFPFGIGDSPNRLLLEGMAKQGQGVAEFVTLQSNAEEAAKRFYRRVAKPLVTGLHVDWQGLPVKDVYPKRIPDLFVDGRPVILKGRYTGQAEGDVTLQGTMDGQPWSHTMHVTLPAQRDEHSPLPSLWAREKIEELQSSDYLGAQTGNPNEAIKEQIIAVALDYRLMSQYTSFVAVEQRVVNLGGKQRTVDVPVEMPEGMSYEGIFGNDGEQADDLLAWSARNGKDLSRDGKGQEADFYTEATGIDAGPLSADVRFGEAPALPTPSVQPPSTTPPFMDLAETPAPPVLMDPKPRTSLEKKKSLPAAPVLREPEPAPVAVTVAPARKPQPQPSATLASPMPKRASVKLRPTGPVVVDEPEFNREDEDRSNDSHISSPSMPTEPTPRWSVNDEAHLRGAPNAVTGSGRAPKPQPIPAEWKLAGALRKRTGNAEIQIWVKAMPKDGLGKLKELGFDFAAELIPGKLLLGTLSAEKLKALAALEWVLYVDVPKFR